MSARHDYWTQSSAIQILYPFVSPFPPVTFPQTKLPSFYVPLNTDPQFLGFFAYGFIAPGPWKTIEAWLEYKGGADIMLGQRIPSPRPFGRLFRFCHINSCAVTKGVSNPFWIRKRGEAVRLVVQAEDAEGNTSWNHAQFLPWKEEGPHFGLDLSIDCEDSVPKMFPCPCSTNGDRVSIDHVYVSTDGGTTYNVDAKQNAWNFMPSDPFNYAVQLKDAIFDSNNQLIPLPWTAKLSVTAYDSTAGTILQKDKNITVHG